jgi:hypothetical protein
MLSSTTRGFLRRMGWIFGIRFSAFFLGWWASTRYADWRQVAGYPLLLIGALPDAVVVRYVIPPRSANWLWGMTLSLLLSSALAAMSLRFRR